MAIVNKYNNTTAIYHGGVSYSSVYKNLVQYFPDPRTPPTPPQEERIDIEIEIQNGSTIYIPTNASYATGDTVSYDWDISVNWWTAVRYTGTATQWTAAYISLSWYTTGQTYSVRITPHWVPTYWWAKAFRYKQGSWRHDLKRIIYDSSYMWYADSATNTWDYFRAWQYDWCDALLNIPDEVLPSTVTTIWNYFRYRQYRWCSVIDTPSVEVMPSTVTSIWSNFRDSQYSWCYHLTTAANEVISSGISTIPNDFRAWQYYNCYDITTVGSEALPSNITSIWDNFRGMQYDWCSDLTSTAIEILPNTVVSIGTYFRRQQYRYCTSLVEIKWIKDLAIGNTNYRTSQFSWCDSNKTIKVFSDVWYNWNEPSYDSSLKNIYITQVQVPSAYLQNFIDTTNKPRVNITDSKFIWY